MNNDLTKKNTNALGCYYANISLNVATTNLGNVQKGNNVRQVQPLSPIFGWRSHTAFWGGRGREKLKGFVRKKLKTKQITVTFKLSVTLVSTCSTGNTVDSDCMKHTLLQKTIRWGTEKGSLSSEALSHKERDTGVPNGILEWERSSSFFLDGPHSNKVKAYP